MWFVRPMLAAAALLLVACSGDDVARDSAPTTAVTGTTLGNGSVFLGATVGASCDDEGHIGRTDGGQTVRCQSAPGDPGPRWYPMGS